MAYGKIKADTLVYDNSGSDAEVTISSLGNKANTASPTFTGTVTIPTPSANDNTTKAASTAYVQTELGDYALLAGPTFTGTPTLPTGTIATTQAAGNTSTAIATTAFVDTSFAKKASPTFTGAVTSPSISIDGQYKQSIDAITPATTPAIDCSLGNFFTLDATSTYPSVGWSFTNVPASCVYSVVIKVTTGGSTTINWNSVAVNGGGASNKIKWYGGAVPAFTAGKPLYIILTTTDTGATWEGTSLIDFAVV